MTPTFSVPGSSEKQGFPGNVISFVTMLFHRARPVFFAIVIAFVLVVAGVVDGVANFGKIYNGVSVGSLDLSGKTREQAAQLIQQEYDPVLQTGLACIFSDEISMQTVNSSVELDLETPFSEQQIVQEALSKGRLWLVDAASLTASVDAEALAEEAFQKGRSDGGFGTRIKAFFSGISVAPRAQYDAEALEALALKLDGALGTPRVDFGVKIQDGVATVTQGNDGTMINRDVLSSSLDAALFAGVRSSFVAVPEYAPLRISAAHAQETADAINRAASGGVAFVLGSGGWNLTAGDTLKFVEVRVEQVGDSQRLVPYVNIEAAAAHILDRSTGLMRASLPSVVSFSVKNDAVMVSTDGKGTIPLARETAESLDAALFGSYRASLQNGGSAADATGEQIEDDAAGEGAVDGSGDTQVLDGSAPLTVDVVLDAPPKSMTFDEALSLGVIDAFSTYTTEYTNTEEDANRNHNIQLAASLLNNSIVKANGGTWSFHEVVGHCNDEAGFLGAGIILNEEHVDAVGGGICQVATTVFNAVYEAGLPINRRHNHTLFVPYYPDGRDAAVSWPDLDLIWGNDCASDVLVTSSWTDTTLTVTLYGVDPQREVITKTGEWEVVEPFSTRLKCDASMKKGESKVIQHGDDARNITIYRTVYDKDGGVLHEDIFYSSYDTEVEIIIAGPGTEIELASGKKIVAEEGKTVSGR